MYKEQGVSGPQPGFRRRPHLPGLTISSLQRPREEFSNWQLRLESTGQGEHVSASVPQREESSECRSLPHSAQWL